MNMNELGLETENSPAIRIYSICISNTCSFLVLRNTVVKLSLQIVCSLIHTVGLYENVFSLMKHIKNNIENRFSGAFLQHQRFSTTAAEVDINSLVKETQNPQHSH